MGGGQSATAEQATQQQQANLDRAYGIAIPLEKQLLGFSQSSLAAGEPGYVKSGFAGFQQSIKDQSRRTMESDLHNAFAGPGAPQGAGGRLQTVDNVSSFGAGRSAAALGQGQFAESNAMFNQTQNLLDVMSGQAAAGLGQSVTSAEQQARAIAMMPQVSSTTSNIFGALNAAGAIYGGVSGAQGPSYGSNGGVFNMTGNPSSTPVSGF